MSIYHASHVIRQMSDNKCRRQKKRCPIVSLGKKRKNNDENIVNVIDDN